MLEERYNKLINSLIPEKNKQNLDNYYKSFLVLSAHLFSPLFLIFFISVHGYIHNYWEVLALSIIVFLFIISFFIYRKTGSNIFCGNLIISGAFIGFTIIALHSEGIYSSVIPWFTATAITGFLFANKKSGYFWSITTILLILFFYISDIKGIKYPSSFLPQYKNLVFNLSFTGSSIYIILIVLSYEYLNNRKNEHLLELLNSNKEKQEELLQQQEEILAQRDTIEDAAKLTHDILKSLPDPAFMIDQSGIVTFWNYEMEVLTGLSESEILGSGNYEYAIPFYGKARPILIDLAHLDDDFLKLNYKGIQKKGNLLQAETYVPNLRGKERYLIGRSIALHDKKNNYSGAIEVIHDITERRKANEKIQEQNTKINASIRYAKRIQKAIFSDIEDVKNWFSDYFIFFKPKNVVSGDFYWAIKSADKLFVAVADCTGHGVPGAFMSLLGISYLNEIVLEQKIEKPHKILEALREKVIKSLHQKENGTRDGMDIALIVIDRFKQKLDFAGAHNPLLIYRNNELLIHKADRIPIGIYYKDKAKYFHNQSIDFQKNDSFYLFTDGYTDQYHSSKGKIKNTNFYKLISQVQSLSFSEQKKKIGTFLEEWKETENQTDDILIIGFKLNTDYEGF